MRGFSDPLRQRVSAFAEQIHPASDIICGQPLCQGDDSGDDGDEDDESDDDSDDDDVDDDGDDDGEDVKKPAQDSQSPGQDWWGQPGTCRKTNSKETDILVGTATSARDLWTCGSW